VLEALEPLAGDHVRPHRRARHAHHAPTHGFAHSFDLFGGAEALDELCGLSNDCSRILNRARAALGEAQTAKMDTTISRLAPLFDVPSGAGGAAAGGDGDGVGEGGMGEEEEGFMGAAYGPVRALVSKARRKAEQMRQELAAAAAAQAAAAAAGQRSERQGSSTSEIEPAVDAVGTGEEQGGGAAVAAADTPAERLQRWRAAAERSLGEVCSGQVMLLLQDARSLSAPARYGRPLDDGMEWPLHDAQAVALLLQGQAARMVRDLHSVAGAFIAPLQEAAGGAPVADADAAGAEPSSIDAEGGREGAAAAAAAPLTLAAGASLLAAQLESERDQAVARVRDSLRENLFVLVLVSLHTQGKLSGPPPAEGGPEAAGGGDDGEQQASGLEPTQESESKQPVKQRADARSD